MAAARTRDRGAAPAPSSDAYVGLLGISLVALILGCVLLFLDWNEYTTTKAPAAPTYGGLAGVLSRISVFHGVKRGVAHSP